MKCTTLLSMDHRAILRALDLLRAVAFRVARNDTEAAADAKTLVGFFQEFADRCHHTKEEMLLFPRLTNAGMPVEGGPLAVMLWEHDQGRSLVRNMSEALEQGKPPAFELYATRYAHLLASHIEKEDYVLFRMVESVLTEEDDEELVEAFDRIEEQMDIHLHERFRHMLLSMEAKYLTAAAS